MVLRVIASVPGLCIDTCYFLNLMPRLITLMVSNSGSCENCRLLIAAIVHLSCTFRSSRLNRR